MQPYDLRKYSLIGFVLGALLLGLSLMSRAVPAQAADAQWQARYWNNRTLTGDPVITTVTRRVRPGHEAAYEAFLEGVISAARRFPGHLGVEVFRPPSVGGEYRTVYRFDSEEHLRAWLDSDEHAAWLERAEPRSRYLLDVITTTGDRLLDKLAGDVDREAGA